MTRKHFIALACASRRTFRAVAAVCEIDNPRFNLDRFMAYAPERD